MTARVEPRFAWAVVGTDGVLEPHRIGLGSEPAIDRGERVIRVKIVPVFERVVPPPEHRRKQWHWLADVDGDVWPARWEEEPSPAWGLPGCDWQADDDMALLGWRYVAPCIPPIEADAAGERG